MAQREYTGTYNPSDFGKKEVELYNTFVQQHEDAYNYFISVIKPRLDRAYKLYIAYTGDRQREIKRWQANIFVPYVLAVVETLMPRILDARPEFSVLGRTEEDNVKAEKQQQLADYIWEISGMDKTSEDFVRASLVYGTGFLQVSWKKDARKLRFLKSKDLSKKKYDWATEERVFYDAPYCEWVDNYALWYDWHNTDRKSKQYWFKRLVLTEGEIRRRYPMADEKRLRLALASPAGDITDYAAIRQQVRLAHDQIIKGGQTQSAFASFANVYSDKYQQGTDRIPMYEVFEWFRPFEDSYAVIVGSSRVPILRGGEMPIPFDFKEAPFIELPYLKIPGEFEGYGVPLILENPQIMLNLIKNQRLDAATLNIHKMWIVNPLANVNRNELVTRPFGIIYSIDPNGVREVQFSDIKPSAYKEEEMLKSDMRYSSGVDDFSMGTASDLQGGGATAVRHLREATLERVRLFVNHLGDAYSDVLRYWIDLSRQLMSKKMTLRIIGKDGEVLFPIVEKNDLMGNFDYRANVLPSIAGQQDVNKKQAMDLFQLLSQIDPQVSGVSLRKLIAKVISNWGWSLDSISEQGPQQPGMGDMDPAMLEAMQAGGMGVDPMMMQQMMSGGGGGNAPGVPQASSGIPSNLFKVRGSTITPDSMQRALSMLRSPAELGGSQFARAQSPINLLQTQGPPPTVPGVQSASGGPGPRGNPRGHNRTGRVNTNIPLRQNASTESNLLNRAFNIQS